MFEWFKRKRHTEEEDAQIVNEALKLMDNGDGRKALRMVRAVARRAPKKGYCYSEVTDEGMCCKFWSMADFMHASDHWRGPGTLVWTLNAYGRACYYTAFLLFEQNRHREALKWLDRRLRL